MPCRHCELQKLPEASRPLDSEFANLIEQAFLEGQIDGVKADFVHWWLWTVERAYQARSPAH